MEIQLATNSRMKKLAHSGRKESKLQIMNSHPVTFRVL